jgi:OOP family OmpA-OmpF porin
MAGQKKNNEILILGISLAVTGTLLAGATQMVNQQEWLPFGMGNTKAATDVAHNSDKNSEVSLKILGDTFSGYSTLRSPAFQGAMTEQGIGIRYQDEFDQQARAQALSQGKADIIVTSLDQYLTHQPDGKIVALVDRTVGADAVMLNSQQYPQLKSLIDLEELVVQKRRQGQKLKIVFAGDTPSEFLATVLDTKFSNFNLTDFEVVRVADAQQAWKLMQQMNENVAVGVLWEPFVTEAMREGNTVVLSSADAPRVIVDVAVASNKTLESRPEQIQAFVESYYRRLDQSVQNPNLLPQQIATDGNLSADQAKSIVEGIDFFTSVKAAEWINSGTLDKRIQAIGGILALSGQISNLPANPQSLYTAQYLQPVAQQTQAIIAAIKADNPELAAKWKGNTETKLVSNTISDAQVQQAEDIGNLQVRGEVPFTTGSATLTAEGQQTLDNLLKEIGEFDPNRVAVKVQGHTSKTGSASLNQQLSQERAAVVVNYLRNKQLPHKMLAEGMGFSHPLPGANPADPVNQRTVIRLVRIDV